MWLQATTDDSGVAYFYPPAAAGTVSNPPAIACYRRTQLPNGGPGDQWLVIGGSSLLGRCGMGSLTDGRLFIYIDGVPRIWPVGVVVIY